MTMHGAGDQPDLALTTARAALSPEEDFYVRAFLDALPDHYAREKGSAIRDMAEAHAKAMMALLRREEIGWLY